MGLFAASLTVTATGSAAYHAALSFDAQSPDVLGMYLTAGGDLLRPRRNTEGRELAAACLARLLGLRHGGGLGAGHGARPPSLVVRSASDPRDHPRNGRTTALRSRPRRDSLVFFAGVAVFAAAFLSWWLDQSLLLCWPTWPLQGHAIWHLLGAAASGLLIVYYAREWSLHS